jgi:hypothetical protein
MLAKAITATGTIAATMVLSLSKKIESAIPQNKFRAVAFKTGTVIADSVVDQVVCADFGSPAGAGIGRSAFGVPILAPRLDLAGEAGPGGDTIGVLVAAVDEYFETSGDMPEADRA